MFTKKDRARQDDILSVLNSLIRLALRQEKRLDEILSAVGAVDQAVRGLERSGESSAQALEAMTEKLDAALEAAHDMGASAQIQAGIQNILNYTGAPRSGEGK